MLAHHPQMRLFVLLSFLGPLSRQRILSSVSHHDAACLRSLIEWQDTVDDFLELAWRTGLNQEDTEGIIEAAHLAQSAGSELQLMNSRMKLVLISSMAYDSFISGRYLECMERVKVAERCCDAIVPRSSVAFARVHLSVLFIAVSAVSGHLKDHAQVIV